MICDDDYYGDNEDADDDYKGDDDDDDHMGDQESAW